MWIVFALFTAVLLFVMLFACPMFAALLYPNRGRLGHQFVCPKSLDIVIPCHNEKGRLKLTLQSITGATEQLKRLFPIFEMRILCGLDACSDGSRDDTTHFAVEVREFQCQSKWRVIEQLVASSQADWVALVDCGVGWHKNLLRNVVPYLGSPDVVAFAPSYSTARSGVLGRIHWKLEAILKKIENRAGGPVSVHGATVFYRTAALKEALQALSGRAWINDDVVIPLILRALNPKQRIVYSANADSGFVVTDHAPRGAAFERTARRRVSQGNLQWSSQLLPFLWVWNRAVMLIALRRVLRIFWSIPILCAGAALSFLGAELLMGVLRIEALGLGLVSTLFCFALLMKIPSFHASYVAIASVLFRRADAGEKVQWN